MSDQEKSLLHQIHPIKLFTDWSTGLIAIYLLWQQNLVVALVVMLIPPIIVSLVLVKSANLARRSVTHADD